jgi:acyl-CoA synthetase (AMP-forming)/AMP-acid ligase II
MDSFQDKANNWIKLLENYATNSPTQIAYSFLDDSAEEKSLLTYEQLSLRAKTISGFLQYNQAKGERVIILLPNDLTYLESFFGCLYAGAIAVTCCLPTRKKHLERILNILRDSQAKFIIATKDLINVINDLWLQDADLLNIAKPCLIDISTIAENWANNWKEPEISLNDLAFLQYTSSSTGAPKAVMVSHGNLLHNCEMMKKGWELNQNDVCVSWLPFFHDMGLITLMLTSLYLKIPAYVMFPNSFIKKPLCWLQAISRYKGTFTAAPNFAYDLCVKEATKQNNLALDLSSWKVAINAAEPVRSETLDKFTATFEPYGFRAETFCPSYGLAEATVFVSTGNAKSQPIYYKVEADALTHNIALAANKNTIVSRSLVSCGYGWLEEKIIIVDPETLKLCKADEIGEIWISGPHIAKGYWQKEAETKATFEAYTSDTNQGPFMRTGDLGFLRKDGELFITSRIKDLIISNGKNHSPQDIEFTVEKCHPAIFEHHVAAFSIEQSGSEELVLSVAIKSDYLARLNPQEVTQVINRVVSREHGLKVHDISFVSASEIFKTTSGKIQRQKCKSQYLEKTV